MQVSINGPPLHSDRCKELERDSAKLWLKQKKRRTLPKKGASTDHRGSVSEHVEMADVEVQVETEADQDEAIPNEMALEDEVEAAKAALKLTDQSDDSHYDSEYFDSVLTKAYIVYKTLKYRNFRPFTRSVDYPHRPFFAISRKKFQQITRTGT